VVADVLPLDSNSTLVNATTTESAHLRTHMIPLFRFYSLRRGSSLNVGLRRSGRPTFG